MRDYDNMPTLNWNEENAGAKAKAQILHQEPVILMMPNDFDSSVEGDKFGCELEDDSGIYFDCDGGKVLQQLAAMNNMDGLEMVAEACVQSSSQVDIDGANNRIIVHD
ncbi:MAG: hypothetical protein HUJ29_04035 [Gammaproteobacteria bacterium]|nr:hypothetical protein [Gammaproteobacteria bacterium]